MNTDKAIIYAFICPYCNNKPEYVDSAIIYGKSYGMVYLCKPCDAYVGVYKDSPKVALGRLANKELREAKKLAHYYFDPIWKNGLLKRQEAYKQLSVYLGIPRKFCHIGMMDVLECEKTVEFCKEYLKK